MMLFAPNDQLQIVTNFKAIIGNKCLILPIISVTFGTDKTTDVWSAIFIIRKNSKRGFGVLADGAAVENFFVKFFEYFSLPIHFRRPPGYAQFSAIKSLLNCQMFH